MSMNDGGPAFPANHFDMAESEHGMSLRDYIAAQALAGLCAEERFAAGMDMPGRFTAIARKAYAYADAMLKERSK